MAGSGPGGDEDDIAIEQRCPGRSFYPDSVGIDKGCTAVMHVDVVAVEVLSHPVIEGLAHHTTAMQEAIDVQRAIVRQGETVEVTLPESREV